MSLNISILGAGGGPEIHLAGDFAGAEGIRLGKGQVQGFYHAPVDTEWKRARRQRGGSFAGLENPARDMQLNFRTRAIPGQTWQETDTLLRSCFTYQLDPWWPGDTLARIRAESDSGIRSLAVQMFEEPDFVPEISPEVLQYGNVFYKLRAGQSFWEAPPIVKAWETAGTSGSGTIEVSNPTDVEMFQTWVLTPGTWTVPDVSWTGRPRARTPGGLYPSRSITLQPVTPAMGSLTIQLDPMHVMMQDASGINVMGLVGGGYYFMHTIPPHTPLTRLPISVTNAPVGGARAELHQPRLWSNCLGGM
ncbi:hypothetical protein [Rhodococcus sp. SJ-2]